MSISTGVLLNGDRLGFVFLNVSCIVLLMIGILAILLNRRKSESRKLEKGEKVLLFMAVLGILLLTCVIVILLTRSVN